jgi:hypothetical protein
MHVARGGEGEDDVGIVFAFGLTAKLSPKA